MKGLMVLKGLTPKQLEKPKLCKKRLPQLKSIADSLIMYNIHFCKQASTEYLILCPRHQPEHFYPEIDLRQKWKVTSNSSFDFILTNLRSKKTRFQTYMAL